MAGINNSVGTGYRKETQASYKGLIISGHLWVKNTETIVVLQFLLPSHCLKVNETSDLHYLGYDLLVNKANIAVGRN